MNFGEWIEKVTKTENPKIIDEIKKLKREPKIVPKENCIRKNYSIYRAGHDNGYNIALNDVYKIITQNNR